MNDGKTDSNTATISITALNETPVANGQNVVTSAGTPVGWLPRILLRQPSNSGDMPLRGRGMGEPAYSFFRMSTEVCPNF